MSARPRPQLSAEEIGELRTLATLLLATARMTLLAAAAALAVAGLAAGIVAGLTGLDFGAPALFVAGGALIATYYALGTADRQLVEAATRRLTGHR